MIRVLIVDDEPIIRRGLRNQLARAKQNLGFAMISRTATTMK